MTIKSKPYFFSFFAACILIFFLCLIKEQIMVGFEWRLHGDSVFTDRYLSGLSKKAILVFPEGYLSFFKAGFFVIFLVLFGLSNYLGLTWCGLEKEEIKNFLIASLALVGLLLVCQFLSSRLPFLGKFYGAVNKAYYSPLLLTLFYFSHRIKVNQAVKTG